MSLGGSQNSKPPATAAPGRLPTCLDFVRQYFTDQHLKAPRVLASNAFFAQIYMQTDPRWRLMHDFDYDDPMLILPLYERRQVRQIHTGDSHELRR